MKQTNSLQKSYDPFANGRWYRVFLESDGTNVKIIDSDFENAYMSGIILNIKDNLYLHSLIEKIHLINSDGQSYTPLLQYVSSVSEIRTYISLNPKGFDYCELFIFGEKKND